MTVLLPPGVKVHLALGYIDMRKGIDGLAMLVQGVLLQDPFSGHSLALGPVKLLPELAPLHDHRGDDEAADHAMRDALTRVAGMYKDVFTAGIAPAEGRIIDGIQYLA
jgi:hypothetical protein